MTMHRILTCAEGNGANNGVCPVGSEPVLITGYIQTEAPFSGTGQVGEAFSAGFGFVLFFYLVGAGVGAVLRLFRERY